jgi:hypothetical protein
MTIAAGMPIRHTVCADLSQSIHCQVGQNLAREVSRT